MLFNSLHFFIYFPLVTALYYLCPHRYRWLLLLIASCYFYMAFIPVYILILAFTIVLDYIAGIIIEESKGQKRRHFLILSLVANVGVLAFFKYFNFFNTNLSDLAQWIGWNYPIQALNIILPIGLSFHTFQSMSYTVEVYRQNQKAERHFGLFALYVLFYPQLVAGPIERPQNLLHQFKEHHRFEYKRVTDGLKLMLWGLFKKVAIADRLAVLVDQVYNHPMSYEGLTFLVATVFFAFEIYCDFSGYSDIAIGSAQVMGFRLMNNFQRPYFSKSISEFWKRWHISLSTWFRDYLYIPLGGNRVGKWRGYYNLLITFVLSGLWHGANWTFIAWGALNGFYLLFALWTKGLREKMADAIGLTRVPRVHQVFQVASTFSLICLSWIFFRANSISDALYIISKIPIGIRDVAKNMVAGNLFRANQTVDLFPLMSKGELLTAIALVGFMELLHFSQRQGSLRQALAERPTWMRWSVYYVMILLTVFLGRFGEKQFIYFQF